MQMGMAASMPASTSTIGGNGKPMPTSVVMTVSATMPPIITTSPWAKLINWMMPYTIV